MSFHQGILFPPPTIPLQNQNIINKPIYVMTIELEQNKTKDLEIFLNSNPEELSYEFCHQHNLDYQSLNYLTEQIKSLLKTYKAKQTLIENNILTTNNTLITTENDIPDKSKETTSRTATIPNKRNQSKDNFTTENSSFQSSFASSSRKRQKSKSSKEVSNLIYKIKHDIKSNRSSSKTKQKQNNISKIGMSKIKQIPISNSNIKIAISKNNFLTRLNILQTTQNNSKQKNKKKDTIKPTLQLETENNHNHNYKPTRVCSSPNLTKKDKHIFQTNVYHKKRRPQSIFNLTSTSKKQHNNDCKSFSETSDKKTKKKIVIPFTLRKNASYKRKSIDKYSTIKNEIKPYPYPYNIPPIDSKRHYYFFHPKTQKLNNNTNHLKNYSNIYNNLNAYAEQYKDNKNQNEINNRKIKETTNDVFTKKKYDVFKTIFSICDNDEDGFISIFTINLTAIPSDVIKILKPIVEDLKEYQGNINENEFIEECNKLFEVRLLIYF